MCWRKTANIARALAAVAAVAALTPPADAAEAVPEPAFDACALRPDEYASRLALALDGLWEVSPLVPASEETADAAPRQALVIEVGPWGLRVGPPDRAERVPLFFEQGEVWDFDPPPWMPRPDPASRVSENFRLTAETRLPCAQHRLPRLYGAGSLGDGIALEFFLTVTGPDRLVGREVRRSETSVTTREITLTGVSW
ncbi:MAG: hypothetical protein AAF565_03575 [Pseudomonadota bacterium]